MYPKYKRRQPAKRTYRKKTIYKRKPTVSLAVKKYVKRTIHTSAENKFVQYIALNQSIAPLTGFSLSLVPVISQGTTQTTRIGNEIKVVGAFVKGLINLLPYNSVSNPLCIQRIRIMVVSMKDENLATLDTTDIWQYNAGSLNLQANIGDTMYSVNKDKFTVYYDKCFNLGSPSQSSLTNNLAGQHFSNDKFQIPFYFNYGKHLKQKLKYNDTTTLCTNRNMFLWITSVNADGTSTAVTPAEAHIYFDIKYEDA